MTSYAEMHRMLAEVNGFDALDGLVCPHPACQGTLRRSGGVVRCDGQHS
ncbi:MAG: hypothetical protein ABEJ28_09320 [Salinigranum sp.]